MNNNDNIVEITSVAAHESLARALAPTTDAANVLLVQSDDAGGAAFRRSAARDDRKRKRIALSADQLTTLAERGDEGVLLVSRERAPSTGELLRAAAHDNLLPCAALGALYDYRCAFDIEPLRLPKKRRRRKKCQEEEEEEEEAPPAENNEQFYALDRRNPVPAFDRIVTLDESTHTYFLDGIVVEKASTTGFIHSFFAEFDTPAAVEAKLGGKAWRKRTDPLYERAHEFVARAWAASPLVGEVSTTVIAHVMELLDGTLEYASLKQLARDSSDADGYRRVLKFYKDTLVEFFDDEWTRNRDEQSALGIAVHDTIERFYRGVISREQLERDERVEIRHHFLAFHDKYIVGDGNDPRDPTTWRYEPFRVELRCYDPELRLCGAIDAIFRNRETGALRDWDWKRSKAIKREGYKNARGVAPLTDVPDANLFHYSLQQHFYERYVREFAAPLEFGDGMGLAVFHPLNPSYQVYEVEPMHEERARLVEHRRAEIARRPQTRIERAYVTALGDLSTVDDAKRERARATIRERFDAICSLSTIAAAIAHVDMCTRDSVRALTARCACRAP